MKKKNIHIIFVVLLLIFAFVNYKTFFSIKMFNSHREFFEQNSQTQKIETWMTLNYLERHYKVNLEEVLGKKVSFLEMKETLGKYCEKNKLNCNEIILSLEKNNNGY